MKKWRCVVCNFVYDEALGIPDEGIPPGTRWQDVPDSWTCRDCNAPRSDFRMVEIDEQSGAGRLRGRSGRSGTG